MEMRGMLTSVLFSFAEKEITVAMDSLLRVS